MSGLVYTLIGDGSSDRLLEHPIRWALHRESVLVDKPQWADPEFKAKGRGLAARIAMAIELYPADILFVHRDAESAPAEDRREEIRVAVSTSGVRYVPVVPVRMTEAWLLHDETAIRRASGNPNGRVKLALPVPAKLEAVPDPKQVLFENLVLASELSGRRRDRLNRPRELAAARARTAELIEDYGPLIGLPAFDAFLSDLQSALEDLHQARSST